MGIYEELGVSPYINADQWWTSMGGSMLAGPIMEAMAEASQGCVRLAELQDAVGGAIARLTQNEAAFVTSSATAGIVLTVAAFMSDLDPEKSERLPNTRGMKKEVIFQKCDRFGEEAAIRIPGARIVEIGNRRRATEADLLAALGQETAAVYTTAPSRTRVPGTGHKCEMVPLERMISLSHERGVPVIVDVAWTVPPKEHLWKFTRDFGADVALVSGGKGLRGPQATGLILGRKDVVKACQQMSPPSCRIGRPMKVGKEELVGIYAAVKHFLNGGDENTRNMAEYIARELEDMPGIATTIDDSIPHVYVRLQRSKFNLTGDQIKEKLLEGEPRILVAADPSKLRVNAATLAEGQEVLVVKKLKEVLLNAAK